MHLCVQYANLLLVCFIHKSKKMRLLLHLAMLALPLLPFKSHAQKLDYTELDEIFMLYADGQYDVVKVKLANAGFKVIKSTPNYSLNGTNHQGDFSVLRSTESMTPLYRQDGQTDDCSISFTTDENEMRQLAKIKFSLTAYGAIETYRGWKSQWMREFGSVDETSNPNCSHVTECFNAFGDRRILIDNTSQRTKLIQCGFHTELINHPYVAGNISTPSESISGEFTYVTFPRLKQTPKVSSKTDHPHTKQAVSPPKKRSKH